MRAMVTSMSGNGFDESASAPRDFTEDPAQRCANYRCAPAPPMRVLLAWAGRLDEAREQMSAVRRRCIDRGAETDLIFVAYFTTLIEVWRGRYADAASVADETVERAQQLGGDHLQIVAMTVQAVVGAYTGREAETREAARRSHRTRAAVRLTSAGGLGVDEPGVPGGFARQLRRGVVALQPLIARFD